MKSMMNIKHLAAAAALVGMLAATAPAQAADQQVTVKSTNRSSNIDVQRTTRSIVKPTRGQSKAEEKPAPRAAEAVKSVQGKEIIDEGVIWALIRNEQFDSAYRTIDKIKAEHPQWKPADKLVEVLENNHADYLIREGQKRRRWSQVVEAAKRYPARFDCEHNYRRLALADAYVHQHRIHDARRVYDAVIAQCGERQRVEALDHAASRLTETEFHRLYIRASKKPMSAKAKSRMAAIAVGSALRGKPTAEELARLTEQESVLLQSKDPSVANTLAWANLEHGKPEHALELFRKSRLWRDNDEALKGEILCLHRLHRSREALDLIQAEQGRIEQHDMQADILPLKAAACGDLKDYACQAESLQALEKIRPLDEGEREALAWAHFQLGNYADSEQLFEGLYRAHPSENHAQGLYLSLQRQGKQDRARDLAGELGGPLRGELAKEEGIKRSSEAAQLFGRDLFHAAQDVDEGYDASLRNVDSTYVRFGGMNRIRSALNAQPMIHTMKLSKFFGEGGYYFDRTHSLRVRVERTFIDAGTPLAEAVSIGTLPALPVPLLVPANAIPTYLNGYEWDLEYRNEGWDSYYASVGQGFIGAGLRATWKGRLGLVHQYDKGFAQGELYRQPHREKLLPYVGLLDPYTGRYWGRVSKNGLVLRGYHGLYDDIPATFDERTGLGIYYEVGAEVLNGVGVKTNNHYFVGLTLPWSFDVSLPWGALVSVGPQIRYEHYKQDQDHFTYGHGGYFSPQWSLITGVNLFAESHEGEVVNYMFNGFVGKHQHRHNASPMLPFTPGVPTIEGVFYPGGRVSDWVYNLRFTAVVELSEHAQLGGEVSYARSSFSQAGQPFATKDLAYLLYLTWNFDPRQGTLRMDHAPYGVQPLF